MARDIKFLAQDLKVDLEEAISTAASEIHYSLQYVSPWWTGSFNTAWEIDDQPISPSLKRVLGGGGSTLAPGNLGQNYPYPPSTPRKAPTRLGHLTQLGRSIYIGNMMNYAGFVVNKKGATMPDLEGKDIEYGEHARNVNQITPRPPSPDWFWIYLQHGRGKFLLKDIDKGFKKAGFYTSKGEFRKARPASVGLGVKYRPTAM
tara:strand:+ start:1411 stop:2019 length:609 start_codon:yes stop_codon:yes gene_type:complete